MKKLAVLLTVLLCPVAKAQTPSFNTADSLYRCGQYEQAIQVAQVIASAAENSGDMSTCMKAWCLMGESYFAAGDPDKARDYCCKCYVEAAKSKKNRGTPDAVLISASLSSTANIYKESGESDEAIKYLRRGIKFDKALNRNANVALEYIKVTDILISQGKYEEALACLDTSKIYISEELAKTRVGAMQKFNAGLCMEALGDSVSAEKYFLETDELMRCRVKEDVSKVPIYLRKLASYAVAKGDSAAARQYYERILSNDISYTVDMSEYVGVYEDLAKFYSGTDDALSAMYARKADSLRVFPELKEFASRLALYYVDFPLREREQVIRNQRLRSAFLISILLLLAVIVLALIIHNTSLKKLALMQKEQNEALRKANAQKDELLEVSKSIADERVRGEVSRIASELGGVPDVKLTKRESEIAALVAEGLLNKEIADHLHISVRTVEFHRNAVYRKLGINNAVELMNYLNSIKNKT